ncbi:MAG TPA: VCBS repeat-containing protein [Kofleriaceae bacterium]|nr:VCBS repeat-containing protein [Kofleriaceae bacterium]
MLSQQGDALYYKQNLGGGLLAPARPLLRQPSLARLGASGPQITDLDGDGRKELAIFTPPAAGYFDRTDDGDFEPFRPFLSQAFVDWSAPNLRHIDLDGDGHEIPRTVAPPSGATVDPGWAWRQTFDHAGCCARNVRPL